VKVKPVVPRTQADRDVDETITYYLEQGAVDAALGFIDALKRAYKHIGRHPATGSPRYAHELNLPNLRFWLVPDYPQVVFYMERDDHIDVWRVLHGQRDIPSWMAE
jgi:toxin ParE1/3/4